MDLYKTYKLTVWFLVRTKATKVAQSGLYQQKQKVRKNIVCISNGIADGSGYIATKVEPAS